MTTNDESQFSEQDMKKVVHMLRNFIDTDNQVSGQKIEEYDQNVTYAKGRGCLYQNDLYISNSTTTGEFNPVCWDKVTKGLLDAMYRRLESKELTVNCIEITTDPIQTVVFNITAYGDIKIDFGFGINKVTYAGMNGKKTISYTYKGVAAPRTIKIFNPENITVFSAIGMQINTFDAKGLDSLEELILPNNNISLLSVTSPSVRRVHIFGNPMCSIPQSMNYLIEKLPDRNNSKLGSIVMYDFVPYGQVESDEHKALVELRKELEKKSIQKDWYFGSAITYNTTEYNKCQDSFKNSNIADIWESAEQGEGVVIGFNEIQIDRNCAEWTPDNFAGTPKMISNDDQSVLEWDISGVDPAYKNDTFHSNATASVIISNGKTRYGLAPKSKIYEVRKANNNNNRDKDIAACINELADNCDIISMSQLIYSGMLRGSEYIYENLKLELKDCLYYQAVKAAIDKGIISTYAVGNHGDYVEETPDNSYMDWILTEVPEIVTVGAFTSFSSKTMCEANCSPATDISDSYVSTIYNISAKRWGNGFGTSFSTPLVASKVALYINLFKKKYGRKPVTADVNKFMDERCVTLDTSIMRSAVGRGYIDFASYNYNEIYRQVPTSITGLPEKIEVKTGETFTIPKATVQPSATVNNNKYGIENNCPCNIISYNNTYYAGTGTGHIHTFAFGDTSVHVDIPVICTKPETPIEDPNTYTTLYDGTPAYGDEIECGTTGHTSFTIQMHVTNFVPEFRNSFFTMIQNEAATTEYKNFSVEYVGDANSWMWSMWLTNGSIANIENKDYKIGKMAGVKGDIVLTVTYSTSTKQVAIYAQGTKVTSFACTASKMVAPDKILIGKSVGIPTSSLEGSTIGRVRIIEGIMTDQQVFQSTLNLLTE